MSEIIKTKLVGVTQDNEDGPSRQLIIKKCVGADEVLLLERETNNSYDSNAIAVYVAPDDDPWDDGEYQIGYISADLASRLAPIIDAGGRVTCVVLEKTGGLNGESFGVNVALGVYSTTEVAEYEKTKTSSSPFFTQPINQFTTTSNSPKQAQSIIQKPVKKGNYRIGTWRAIIGITLLFTAIFIFTINTDFIGFIIIIIFFLTPAIILLFPWERWLFDQIKKMFARKHS